MSVHEQSGWGTLILMGKGKECEYFCPASAVSDRGDSIASEHKLLLPIIGPPSKESEANQFSWMASAVKHLVELIETERAWLERLR